MNQLPNLENYHIFKKKRLQLNLSIFLLFIVSVTNAQELEPRSYTNIPVGLNFLVTGYSYNQGGILFDPSVPLDNANVKINSTVLVYARSINVGGLSGKIDMIFPYAWLSGTADYQGEKVSREVGGMGDPRVRFSMIFVGAPAMPISGFKDYKQDFVVGASLQVFLPLGQYDHNRLVNIGTNRFAFKPEIGISKTFDKLVLELSGAAGIFTVNHDFYMGTTRSQNPIGAVQGHGIYNFRKGIWAAIDGTYYWGGRTTTNGVEGNDLQKNTRFGATFAFPLSMHHSIKLHASAGISTRTGTDYDSFAIYWQYRWGGGLPKKK